MFTPLRIDQNFHNRLENKLCALYNVQMTSKNIKTIALMMAITLTGKAMGILRDRMQATYFGTYSTEGIAFTQASILPLVFLDVMFASVISASFIPIFNKYLENEGKQAAFALAARFIRIVLLATIVATIIAVIFAGPLYAIFLDGADLAPAVRMLGVRLLRMMFPIMMITSLAFAFTGVLQSLGQYYIPAAMSVASNSVILLYYFFLIERFGVYGLAVAFLIGWSCQVLIQIPFLIKVGFFAKRTESAVYDLRDIGKLALPVMVASWLGSVNFLVNARASVNLYGGEHGVVSIRMAHNLYLVITGIVVLSVANLLFPTLSKFAARSEWQEYEDFLRSSLRSLLFLLIPMSLGLMAVARPLVALVYQGGRFQETSVEITALALFFYSIGIVGFGFQVILSRACFALEDGKGPLVTALIAMALNFILSFALAPSMEIAGPALASSLAVSMAALGLFIRLRGRLTGLWTLDMTVDAVKILILAALMYLILWWFEFGIVGAVVIGAGFYFCGALIFRVKEARMVVEWINTIVSQRRLRP